MTLERGQFVTIGKPIGTGSVIYYVTSLPEEIARAEAGEISTWSDRPHMMSAVSTRSRRSYTGYAEKFIPIPLRDEWRIPYYAHRKRDGWLARVTSDDAAPGGAA